MVVKINDKEHLIKILRSLLNVEDIDVIKYSLESLIDSLEDEESKEDNL